MSFPPKLQNLTTDLQSSSLQVRDAILVFGTFLTLGMGTVQCTVTKSVAVVPSTWRNEALPEKRFQIKLYKKLNLFPHMGFKLCKMQLRLFFFFFWQRKYLYKTQGWETMFQQHCEKSRQALRDSVLMPEVGLVAYSSNFTWEAGRGIESFRPAWTTQ